MGEVPLAEILKAGKSISVSLQAAADVPLRKRPQDPYGVWRGSDYFSTVLDQDGNTWFGSVGEILERTEADDRWVAHYEGIDLMATNPVYSGVATDDGDLWFGTQDGALRRSEDGTWTTYSDVVGHMSAQWPGGALDSPYRQGGVGSLLHVSGPVEGPMAAWIGDACTAGETTQGVRGRIALIDAAERASTLKVGSCRALWTNADQPWADSRLTRNLDLSEASGSSSVTLSFDFRYDYVSNRHFSFVEVSADGGRTFVQTRGFDAATGEELTTPADYEDPLGRLEEYGGLRYGYTGSSGEWIRVAHDLTPWAGQSIQLRFRYATDGNSRYQGGYIDHVSVAADGRMLFDDPVEGDSLDDWRIEAKSFRDTVAVGWKLSDGRLGGRYIPLNEQLLDAQSAGAVAAVVFAVNDGDASRDIDVDSKAVVIPNVMIDRQAGLELRDRLQEDVPVALRLDPLRSALGTLHLQVGDELTDIDHLEGHIGPALAELGSVEGDVAWFGPGCTSAPPVQDVAGKIALIRYSTACSFAFQALDVQLAGASAAVFIENGSPLQSPGGGTSPEMLSIPSVMIDESSGNVLRDRLLSGADVRAQMEPSPEWQPFAGPARRIINSTAVDLDGNVLFGTNDGIFERSADGARWSSQLLGTRILARFIPPAPEVDTFGSAPFVGGKRTRPAPRVPGVGRRRVLSYAAWA